MITFCGLSLTACHFSTQDAFLVSRELDIERREDMMAHRSNALIALWTKS